MGRLIRNLVMRCGGFALWRWLKRDEIVILTLHGVMDEEADTSWRPLRAQYPRASLKLALGVLTDYYTFVTLDHAVAMLQGEVPMEQNCMVLTLDDGYFNNLKHAMPILREHEVPVLVYAAVGNIEQRKPFWFDRLDYAIQLADVDGLPVSINGDEVVLRAGSRKELRKSYKTIRDKAKQPGRSDAEMLEELDSLAEQLERRAGRALSDIFEEDDWTSVMSWDQLREMQNDRFAQVGSHTVSHTRLGHAGQESVEFELSVSKQMLEQELGDECRHFCYPNGSFGENTPAMVRAAGYRSATTTEEGANRVGCDPMLLKRIHLPESAARMDVLYVASGLADSVAGLRKGARG
jgi:peptidoglycan/xylan/chitin deacetylase (PgdA/CDA1 family)